MNTPNVYGHEVPALLTTDSKIVQPPKIDYVAELEAWIERKFRCRQALPTAYYFDLPDDKLDLIDEGFKSGRVLGEPVIIGATTDTPLSVQHQIIGCIANGGAEQQEVVCDGVKHILQKKLDKYEGPDKPRLFWRRKPEFDLQLTSSWDFATNLPGKCPAMAFVNLRVGSPDIDISDIAYLDGLPLG